MKKKREALREKIARERRELGLKPWQYAPSEIDAGECPYPAHTAGYASWQEAQRMRAQIREKDPDYFNDDRESGNGEAS